LESGGTLTLVKLRWYLIILSIFLIIAIIHGIILTPAANIFISWLFVGFWCCFTLTFFQRIKTSHSFNSPHNTAFFIIVPLLIGLFYSFWGYFTGLIGWNILGHFGLSLSLWTIIFAIPYLIYGSFSLYSCFTRYDFIYIGKSSFNARKFGIFLSSLTLFIIIFPILIFYRLPPIHTSFDLMLLLLCSFTIFLIIRYGIFGTRPNIAQISASISTTRPRRLDNRTISVPSSATSSQSSPNGADIESSSRGQVRRTPSAEISSHNREKKSRESERKPKPAERKPAPTERKPRPAERKPKPAERKPASTERKPKPAERKPAPTERKPAPTERKPKPAERKPAPTERKPKPAERKPAPTERKPKPAERKPQPTEQKPRPEITPEMEAKFKKFRPKAGALSLDDFKCVFCFKLPQLPGDEGRGIILCPNCKHPAHADEFKNWLTTSTLCSRCDTTIPANFRRNPEIIPIKDYQKS